MLRPPHDRGGRLGETQNRPATCETKKRTGYRSSESKKLGGTALVTSALAYRNDTKQFFLSNPEINKLSIQGIPQQHLDKATEFATTAAREYLQEFPIYTLKATDTKTTAAKLLLKDVQVKSSEIHATLGL